MAQNYVVQVTAGPSKDPASHQVVAVNTAEPLSISSELVDIELNVRVENYRGLPKGSPESSPYFSTPPHSKNGDRYSISFSFTPKKSINGDHLLFGNDFDHPIRDRLPPGFSTALRIVKWAIDPGLDGDPEADEPYLYGPLGSSINTLRVGSKTEDETEHVEKGEAGLMFSEGGDGDGEELREEKGVPETEAGRKKWFLNQANRKTWEFEAGRKHWGDFFNPYLDFNNFALRLPGITIPIMKYWDGQSLRYVLLNRETKEVYLVVLFTLYHKDDVDEEGNIKEGVIGGQLVEKARGVDDDEGEVTESEMSEHLTAAEPTAAEPKAAETSVDDID